LNKPIFYEKEDQHYINLFNGLPYDLDKKPTEEIQRKIDFIWMHIKNIWCSKNEKQYNFVRKWIINVMIFKRNFTALYLRSKPGTGKSLIAKFFCRILKKFARIVKKPGEVLDRFNHGLEGKMLVLFEDMPVNSIGEWNKYSDTMLELITGEELTVEKKHVNSYDTKNLVNIIIDTNNDAIKITSEDRRYACLDVSGDMIGNEDYFIELGSYLEDKEVEEAFYIDCANHKEEVKNFNPHGEIRKLETEMKIELKAKYLPHYVEYIKEAYVAKGKEIKDTFPNFYKNYVEWLKRTHNKKPEGNKELLNMLRKDGIELEQHNSRTYFTTKIDRIIEIFTKRGWITEADDVGDVKSDKPATTCGFDDECEGEMDERTEIIIKSRDNEINDLKKQLEEFKEQIDDKNSKLMIKTR